MQTGWEQAKPRSSTGHATKIENNRYPWLLAALFAGGWSSAHAADPPPADARDCSKINDYREMVGCYAQNAGAADTELTRVYESLLHKLPGSLRRDLLASSQAAWMAYRAAYCALESSAVEDGSLQPVARNACHAAITRLRIKELDRQLNCKEGDVACVVPNRQP